MLRLSTSVVLYWYLSSHVDTGRHYVDQRFLYYLVSVRGRRTGVGRDFKHAMFNALRMFLIVSQSVIGNRTTHAFRFSIYDVLCFVATTHQYQWLNDTMEAKDALRSAMQLRTLFSATSQISCMTFCVCVFRIEWTSLARRASLASLATTVKMLHHVRSRIQRMLGLRRQLR